MNRKQSDSDRAVVPKNPKQTKSQPNPNRLVIACPIRNAVAYLFLVIAIASFSSLALAQEALPFKVSNPGNKKWSPEQAARIYTSACDLLARTIRPEKPPQLHPSFVLVLGAEDDEFVRNNGVKEIHLKSWDPAKFAEAVVLVAARDVVTSDDMEKIVQDSIVLDKESMSVNNVRRGQ